MYIGPTISERRLYVMGVADAQNPLFNEKTHHKNKNVRCSISVTEILN